MDKGDALEIYVSMLAPLSRRSFFLLNSLGPTDLLLCIAFPARAIIAALFLGKRGDPRRRRYVYASVNLELDSCTASSFRIETLFKILCKLHTIYPSPFAFTTAAPISLCLLVRLYVWLHSCCRAAGCLACAGSQVYHLCSSSSLSLECSIILQ